MKIDFINGDYHVHSCYSDGTYTPEEIVEWALEKGLEEIAITDHDGVGGIERAKEAARGRAENGGRLSIVNGIEFSAETEHPAHPGKVELHILGYGIDTGNDELLERCRWMMEKRLERNEKLISALKDKGVEISCEEIMARKGAEADGSFIGKPDMARLMIEKGYIGTKDEAFDRYFDAEPFKRIRKSKIDAAEAVKIIKQAGGQAVLAHPGKIKKIGNRESEEFRNNFEALLRMLRDAGLEGLECYYPEHSSGEERMFLEYAGEYGLFATKGSDFHGD